MKHERMGDILLQLNLSDNKHISPRTQYQTGMFYLLSGSGRLVIGEEVYEVRANEFYIINAGNVFSFTSADDILHAYLILDMGGLPGFIDACDLLFCTAPIGQLDKVILFQWQHLLMQMIHLKITKDDYAPILLSGYVQELIYLMLRHCRVEMSNNTDKKNVDQLRLIKIRHYLYSHYKEMISLHDLAQYMFLSDAYMSKYIKKYFGQNFLNYLNSIRLESSCAELLSHPEYSVLQVALSNGFPNISSFNKSFKKKYNMPPSQYRKMNMQTENKQSESMVSYRVMAKSSGVLAEHFANIKLLPTYNQEQEFLGDTSDGYSYERNWNKVLNAGVVSDLLRFDIQEHVLFLVKTQGFQYIRMWDFFSDEMMLNIEGNQEMGNYNFVKLDRVFDFLIKNNIKPFLELAFKPIVLLKNLDEVLISQPRNIVFSSLTQYDEFLNKLLNHFCMRYGETEVNNWIFELWWSRNHLNKSFEAYLRLFKHTKKHIKKHASHALIGGAGFELLKSGEELKYHLNEWNNTEFKPDFVSVYAYPYNINGVHELIDGRRIQNENYMQEWIGEVRAIADKAGFNGKKIFVTEWNFSLSSRNILHDSCFIGTHIIKNVLATIGRADILAYWRATDLYSEYHDISSILYGGEGLLSRDGIRKPAYYAFDFLNHLGEHIIGRGENYIITQNGRDDFRIVCCNYKHPNIRYYQEDENLHDLNNLDYIFPDQYDIAAKVKINGVSPGTYYIKVRKINREAGSVQDEWKNISIGIDAGEDDITYLKNICIPRISMQVMETGGVLEFNTLLKEQEIQYIHIKQVTK